MLKPSDCFIPAFLAEYTKTKNVNAAIAAGQKAITEKIVRDKILQKDLEDLEEFKKRRIGVVTEQRKDVVEHILPKAKSTITEKDMDASYKPIDWWRDGFDYAIKNKDGSWIPTNDKENATHLLQPGKENVDEHFQKDAKGRFISRPDPREVPILSCATIALSGTKLSNMLKGSEGLPSFKFVKRIPKRLFGFKKESSIEQKQFLLMNIVKKCSSKESKKELLKFIVEENSHETLDRLFSQFAKAARNIGIMISRRPSEIAKKERFKAMAESWRQMRKERKEQESLGVFAKVNGVRL